jgi:hypothetical protein
VNLHSRAYDVVSWTGIGALALAIVFLLARGNASGVAVVALFLVASLAFLAFEKRLPALFDLLFVAAAMINGAGWVWDLYSEVWGYDEVAHFYTAFAATLSLGYLTFYAMRSDFRARGAHFIVVVTSFGVTLGAWWEVAEWAFLKKLKDPVSDVIADSLGAFLAALLALVVLKHESNERAASHDRKAAIEANQTG